MTKKFPEMQDRDCRWIDGHPDGLNTEYCGKRAKPGFSYCPEHAERAYQGIREFEKHKRKESA